MGFRSLSSRALPGLFLSAAVVFLAGCQSDKPADALDLNAQDQTGDQSEEAVRESELRAYCPPVTLKSGTAYFTTYKGSDRTNPENVIYQASIIDVTRSCEYGSEGATMTVAVAGKVVPGPAGGEGTITMPIRIAATRGDAVLYSQLFRHEVAVDDTSGATQFIFTDPGVTIPAPVDGTVQVLAGYDEGPYNTR